MKLLLASLSLYPRDLKMPVFMIPTSPLQSVRKRAIELSMTCFLTLCRKEMARPKNWALSSLLGISLLLNSPSFAVVNQAKCNNFIQQVRDAIDEFKWKNPRQYSRCALNEGLSFYDEVGNEPKCYIAESNYKGQLKRFAISYYTSDDTAKENLTYLKNYCAL